MKDVCIVGVGNMGGAMLDILESHKMFNAWGCRKKDDLNVCIGRAEVVVFAVKPQNFEAMVKEIEIDLDDRLIVSIMAGISLERLKKSLGSNNVVRVMPNLPLKVGKSLSGWIASPETEEYQKQFVKTMLRCLGDEIEVDEESKIDAITALSGSGPAYFYLLAEEISKAAQEYGFSEEDANLISESTLVGAGALLRSEGVAAKTLRERVSSKGGTTEAAMKKFGEHNYSKIVSIAIEAARKRSEELNKN